MYLFKETISGTINNNVCPRLPAAAGPKRTGYSEVQQGRKEEQWEEEEVMVKAKV